MADCHCRPSCFALCAQFRSHTLGLGGCLASTVSVVLFDGRRAETVLCESTSDGTLRTVKRTPRLEFAVDVAVPAGPGSYLVLADSVTLLAESDFHAARRRVVLSSLFSNQADWMEWARNIGSAVAVAASMITWLTVSGMSGEVHALLLLAQKVGGK